MTRSPHYRRTRILCDYIPGFRAHWKVQTLTRELHDATEALGNEPTEENWRWLQDVRERLAAAREPTKVAGWLP